jgi:DNA primase
MFKPEPNQIRDWIEDHFDYKTRKNGQEYIILNPFYHNDKTKFNINVEKGICHDWRSDAWSKGSSPTFLRFVQLYNRCSFAEAIRDVCGDSVNLRSITRKIQQQKNEHEFEEKKHQRQVDMVLPAGSVKICESPHPKMASIVTSYLDARGIGEELIAQYDLYHSADSVVWPYYEYEELVYYQSRSTTNKKFDFPAGVDKGNFLYGFDMIEPSDYIIITEAIIDAMTLGTQCGATGGAGLSKMQVRKIRALNPVNGVILAPDNDKAGINSILSDYKSLSPYFKMYYAIPPKIHDGQEVKDWNDLGKMIGFIATREHFETMVQPLNPCTLSTLVKLI